MSGDQRTDFDMTDGLKGSVGQMVRSESLVRVLRRALAGSTALVGIVVRPVRAPSALHVASSPATLRERAARLLALAIEPAASLLARIGGAVVRRMRRVGPVARLRRRWRVAVVAGAAALGLLGTPVAAQVVSTWNGAGTPPTTSDYNTAANWSNLTVPAVAGQSAIFAGSGNTAVNVSTTVAPDAWTFNAASQSYTITGSQVNFGGTGVTSNAATGTTINIANVIGGTGGVTQAGGGTLVLTGANTYSNATTISGGTVVVNNDTALGTGTVTVNGGTLSTTTGANLGNNIATQSGRTATFLAASGTSLNLNLSSGKVGGTLNFGSATATGTIVFGGGGGGVLYSNTTLVLNGGTLRNGFDLDFDVSGGGGQTSFTTVVNAGTLDLNNTTSTISNLQGAGGTVTTGTGALTVNQGTYAGAMGTVASFTKATTGTLTLTGASTYATATTVNAGILNIRNAAALGTADGTTATGTTVASGATLQLQGGITVGNEALQLSGAGSNGTTPNGALENVSGTNTYGGAITLAAASRINSDAGTLTLNAANAITGGFGLTLGGAGNGLVSGTVTTGANTLTKDGAGTWTLTGANTYSGGTTVTTGTLVAANDAALGTGPATVTAGGTLGLQGAVTVGNALSIAGAGVTGNGALEGQSGNSTYGGAITLTAASRINADAGTGMTLGSATPIGGNYALTLGGAGNGTVASPIGTASLTKDGAGTWTLTGASTYTGSTTITAGTLSLLNNGGNTIAGTSGVVFNNTSGTATLQTAANESIGYLFGSNASNNVVIANGTTLNVTGTAGGSTYAGTINTGGATNGTGVIAMSGATGNAQTLTGTMTGGALHAFSGTLTLGAGGTLNTAGVDLYPNQPVGSAGTTPVSVAVESGAIFNNAGTITLSGGGNDGLQLRGGTFNNTGSLEGATASGIYAYSGGTVSNTGQGRISGANGIYFGANIGTSTLTVTGGGSITGTNGTGIYADNGSGNVTLGTTATGGALGAVAGIGSYGIYAVTSDTGVGGGAGTISIVTGGAVSSTTTDAIYVAPTGSGTATVTLGTGTTVTGASSGNGNHGAGVRIAGTGTGDGTIDVTGTGVTVTGDMPAMLVQRNGANAAINVTGTGNTFTGSSGLDTDQQGPGNFSSTVTVVKGNTVAFNTSDPNNDPYNGQGIFAGNQGTGTTSISFGATGTGATSVTGNANGIVLAQSNGGNGNAATVTVGGDVTANGQASAFPNNNPNGYGTLFTNAGLGTAAPTGYGVLAVNAGSNTVEVDQTAGTIQATADGIDVRSTGTGAIVVNASGGQIGTSTTSVGGNGITATRTTAGAITVTGLTIYSAGFGIIALNNSGGAGDITVNANGSITASGNSAIAAQTGGAGNVVVTTASGTTLSSGSAGKTTLFAQNFGAGPGYVQVTNAATLTRPTGTNGDVAINALDAYGVAASTGGLLNGVLTAISVNNSGTITNNFAIGGIFGRANSAGAVIIADSGNITVGGTGILALNQGTGNVTVSQTAGTIQSGADAIDATVNGTGAIVVNASGGQIGTSAANRVGGIGINATGATPGSVAVTYDTIFATGVGVNAGITGAGATGSITVNPTAAGTAIVSGGDGIDAITAGTGAVTVGGNLAIGPITTTNGSGIRATATSGVVAVTANGNVAAGGAGNSGIFLTGNNAANTVTVGANGATTEPTVQGAIGLRIAGTGTTTLTNNGTIATTATGANANALQIDGGTLAIGNAVGTLTGNIAIVNRVANGANGPSVLNLAYTGAATLTLANTFTGAGTFNNNGTGLVNLIGTNNATNGQFTGTANINAGTVAFNGIFGDALNNTATVNVNNSGTLHGAGTIAGDVVVNGGGIVSAGSSPGPLAGTLTVGRNFTLTDPAGATPGSTALFEVSKSGVVGGSNNDLINVGGTLQLGGTLTLASSTNPGEPVNSGYYRLFNYNLNADGSAETGNFATTNVPAGETASVYVIPPGAMSTTGQVNVLVNNGGQIVQFWDGADMVGIPGGAAGPQGGSGTWNATNTNWTTSPDGEINSFWRSGVGIFTTVGGTVALADTESFQGLQFSAPGYLVTGGTLNVTGDPLTTAGFSFVTVDGGVTAEIDSNITGTGNVGLRSSGAGTLIFGGAATYAGLTEVQLGTFVNNGSIASGVTVSAGAIYNNTGVTNGGLTNAGTVNASAGQINGAVANNFGGQFNVTGGVTTNGTSANAFGATLTVSGNGNYTVTGALTNAGLVSVAANTALSADTITTSGMLNTAGTVTTANGLTNTGMVNATGGAVNGPIANNAGGQFNVTGGLTSTGPFANAQGATLAVSNANQGNYAIAGALTNAGLVSVAANTALSADTITTSGMLNTAGTVTTANGLTNTGMVNATGGAVNGPIANNAGGQFNVTGGVTSTGPFANAQGATLAVSNANQGNYAIAGALTNAGLVSVAANTTLSANTITTSGMLNTAGTVTTANGLTNTGMVNATGGAVNGPIANIAGGQFNVTGGVTSTGPFANAQGATLAVSNANQGNYAIAGALTNAGLVSVAANTALSAKTIITSGTLNTVGTVTTANGLTNSGTVNASGVVSGPVFNNAQFNVAGALTGNSTFDNNQGANLAVGGNSYTGLTTLSNAGLVSVGQGGTLGANAINNSGTLNTAGTVATTTALTNLGTVNATGGAVNGPIANAAGGRFNVTGPVTSDGNFNNSAAATLTVSNTGNYAIAQTLTNAGTVSVTGGTLSANAVNNSGTVTWAGTLRTTAGFTNTGTANGSGVIGGPVFNRAVFTVTGPLVGDSTFDNAQGGTLNVGANSYTGMTTLTNAGAVAVGAGGTLGANAINNAATGTITSSGTVATAAGLSNSGTVNATGGAVNGPINNRAGGQFNVSGPVTSDSTFDNQNNGTLLVANGGAYRVAGIITNAGELSVRQGGALTAAGITNLASGVVTNDGTITDVLRNAGVVTNNGTYNATVATNSGAITNEGVWSGAVLSSTGTIVNDGTWTTTTAGFTTSGTLTTTGVLDATRGGLTNTGTVNARGTVDGAVANDAGTYQVTGALIGNSTFTNASGATLAVDGNSYTGLTTVTNAGGVTLAEGGTIGANRFDNAANGTLTATGGTVLAGMFDNAGTVAASGRTLAFGSATRATTFNNAGTVAMANNVVGDVTTINGAYNAVGSNATVTVDVDFGQNPTNGVRSDVLVINGATSGNTKVDFSRSLRTDVFTVSPNLPTFRNGTLINPTPVIISNGGGTFTPSGGQETFATNGGLVQYALREVSPGNYDVVSGVNTAGVTPIATALSSAFGAITTNFFQSSSAFVTPGPVNAPDTLTGGPWIRVSGGSTTIDANGSDRLLGESVRSRTDTTFSGFQAGVDSGIMNLGGSSTNYHIGVTTGVVDARTSERLATSTQIDFNLPFVGVYGAMKHDNIAADLTYRHDFTDLKVTNASVLANTTRLNGNGDSVYGNLLYAIGMGGYQVVPSLGIGYSHYDIDRLGTLLGGNISFRDIDSILGRVGVQVGRSFNYDRYVVQPFVTGAVWHEFAGDTLARFSDPSGLSDDVRTTRVGTFGQVGVGVSAQITPAGFTSFARGDFRFGDKLNGATGTLGMRYSF